MPCGGLVEVAAGVDRARDAAGRRQSEQEELHLGVGVEAEPEAAALASARLSANRGSANDGEPSGSRTSQKMRAVPGLGSPRQHLERAGSGRTSMSASWTRAKPSIEEPSKPTPS